MQRDLDLSEEVKSYIDTLDQEYERDIPLERREAVRRDHRFGQLIVKTIVQSRETITDARLKVVEELVHSVPDAIESLLDDYFTREVLDAVPGYVRRTLDLSRLDADRLPSGVTNGYLREAVRTYILGLPQASVALCRAALEQALKESLGRQLSGEFIAFQDLLKESRKWNILDQTMEAIARDVANAGDEVMHEKPTDLIAAERVLTEVRGLLQHIYSAQGGF